MLKKDKIPVGVFLVYIAMMVVVIITQGVTMFGFGLTIEDQVRIGSISNLVGYGFAFFALWFLFFNYLRDRFDDVKKNYQKIGLYVLCGFGALIFLGITITAIYEIIGLSTTPANQDTLNAIGNAELFDKISLVLFAVLFAPFVEEMVFRAGLINGINSIFKHSQIDKTTVAVRRGADIIIPDADTVIEDKDQLLLIGSNQDLQKFNTWIQK